MVAMKLTAHDGMASAEAWHGLVEHVAFGGAGGDVMLEDPVAVFEGGAEVVEELLALLEGGAKELLLEEGADEDGDAPGAVVVAPLEQGVVGWAVTQAHREFAAPNTPPAEAPQALITQPIALDWIAED
jgi:hypothetical protein